MVELKLLVSDVLSLKYLYDAYSLRNHQKHVSDYDFMMKNDPIYRPNTYMYNNYKKSNRPRASHFGLRISFVPKIN